MPNRINLVPKTERARTATNVPALIELVAAILVVFALGFSYYWLSSERGNLENELEDKEKQSAELQTQVNALAGYKVLAAEVSTMEAVVKRVYAGRTLISKALSDLSLVIPENVWVTSFTITAGDPLVEVEGLPGTYASGIGQMSMQGNTYSFPDVAVVLVRLKLVGALMDITLTSAGPPFGNVDPNKDCKGFTLSAAVVNTQPEDTELPLSKVEVEGL